MKKVKIQLRRVRRQKRLTQQQVANKAHLSKTTISNLESGKQVKIELDTIGKLCQALKCTPNDIFGFDRGWEEETAQKQKEALDPFIESLNYTKHFDPKELDKDLANL